MFYPSIYTQNRFNKPSLVTQTPINHFLENPVEQTEFKITFSTCNERSEFVNEYNEFTNERSEFTEHKLMFVNKTQLKTYKPTYPKRKAPRVLSQGYKT